MGPITSALAGIALGAFGEWGVNQVRGGIMNSGQAVSLPRQLCMMLFFLDDSPSKEEEVTL
eukprot:763997-Hanusia_phi.AAC.10